MRNRIHNKGTFVDSTNMYGPMVDRFDNLQVSVPKEDTDKDADVIHMTRKQYEHHILIRSLHRFLRIYLPTEAQLEVSKRFLRNRKESYKLRHKNRKAPQEQGLSLVVA